MIELDRNVAVLGTGSFLPSRVVTNDELAGLVSNYDETSGDFSVWVDRVTHIQERRFVDPETENPGTMGLVAARRALEAASMEPGQIDHVIFAGFTQRQLFPGDHTWMVNELGLNAGVFGLAAACAGSLWGMTIARSMVQAGQYDNVLVVGSETIAQTVDWTDPITAILFSDMAGAVVIGAKDDGEDTGFVGKSIHRLEYADDNIRMWNPAVPRAEHRIDGDRLHQDRAYLIMEGGPRVLRNAVNRMADTVVQALGFTRKDLKEDNPELRSLLNRVKVIPHQANGRILNGLQQKLGVPKENLYRTIYRTGNASAATNLYTLDYAVREGNLWREPPPEGSEEMGEIVPCGTTIQKGDLVVVTSIGGGYLFGAIAFVHAY